MYFEIYKVGYIECISTRYVVKSQAENNYEMKGDMQARERRKVLGLQNPTKGKHAIVTRVILNP